jgi:hypothetical protein
MFGRAREGILIAASPVWRFHGGLRRPCGFAIDDTLAQSSPAGSNTSGTAPTWWSWPFLAAAFPSRTK